MCRCCLERLDGPALSVQFCNGNCFKGEVIRQKSIHYVLRKVLINDQAQQIRVLLGCKETCKTDCLVRDDASLPVNLARVSCTLTGVSIMKLGMLFFISIKVCILKAPFVMMELRPWTELQTQVDGTAVKGIHHIVNAQPIVFIFIQDFSLLDKYHCVVLIDTPVLLLVHVGESGLGHHLQTGMIQLGVESSQLSLYATKACAAGQLSITHDKELVTASESSCMKISSISVNTFPELVVRDERHQLREYSISGIHILCYLIYETVQR